MFKIPVLSTVGLIISPKLQYFSNEICSHIDHRIFKRIICDEMHQHMEDLNNSLSFQMTQAGCYKITHGFIGKYSPITEWENFADNGFRFHVQLTFWRETPTSWVLVWPQRGISMVIWKGYENSPPFFKHTFI